MATTPGAAAAPQETAAPAEATESQPPEDASLGVEGDDDEGVGDFSLADLAGLDISEVEEIRSERLPVGAYIFRGKKAELQDTENRDGERRFVAQIQFEVAEVQAITEKGYNPEDVVGKTHTERFYIVPEKAHEGIGRIRAFYADVNLDNKGALGGVEGMPLGVLDRIVDHLFPAKITARKQDGETYARMKLPKKNR